MNMAELQSVITTKAGSQVIGKQPSPILPKTKGPDVNLRDRLNTALSTEKSMSLGYTTSANEAIDPSLYGLLKQNREEAQGLQRKFFEALFDIGEYTADLATSQHVTDAVDTFTNYRAQLPYGQRGGPQTVH